MFGQDSDQQERGGDGQGGWQGQLVFGEEAVTGEAKRSQKHDVGQRGHWPVDRYCLLLLWHAVAANVTKVFMLRDNAVAIYASAHEYI